MKSLKMLSSLTVYFDDKGRGKDSERTRADCLMSCRNPRGKRILIKNLLTKMRATIVLGELLSSININEDVNR